MEWGKKDACKDKEKNSLKIKELNSAISEIDKKLERLLDGYLDQAIDTGDYQKKKNELIQNKVGIEEKIREIEQGGWGWLGPFGEFVNCACKAQKIAHTKNNGHDLLIMAKTVGSDFFLLNKTITPKYKNAAYNALATHAPVASASLNVVKMSLLLPREDSNLEPAD